jgi:hypothetical protein
LIPSDDFFLGETARDEASSIARHDGLFRAFHVVAVLGTASAALGVVTLARWLRTTPPARLANVAAALAGIGVVAWAAEVAFRLTVTVSRAHEVVDGSRSPGDEPAIGSWILFAVAGLGFVAPMVCSWALAARQMPGRRSSLIVAGLVSLTTVVGVATLAPSVVYQFGVFALGVALVAGSRRTDVGTAEVPSR